MGAAGRAVALEEFTEARMVDRFVELYQSIAHPSEQPLV
jgi:hypothetical protein